MPANNEDVDLRFKKLADEIEINMTLVYVLANVYTEFSGARLQNEDEFTDDEFAAFRTYVANNYKKMCELLTDKVILQEEEGTYLNVGGAPTFKGQVALEVSSKIEQWALANSSTRQ